MSMFILDRFSCGQFALHFEFAELRFVVGVGNRAGAQAVAMLKLTS